MLQNELLDQLLYLAERKYRVFPCWSFANGGCACGNAQCGNIAKHPATRHGCKDATTDEAQIRRWVSESNGRYNWAIATGNGFGVLDIDPKNDGDDSWLRLPTVNPRIPAVLDLPKPGQFAVRRPHCRFFRHRLLVTCIGDLHRTGLRKTLEILGWREQSRAGSSPVSGTRKNTRVNSGVLIFYPDTQASLGEGDQRYFGRGKLSAPITFFCAFVVCGESRIGGCRSDAFPIARIGPVRVERRSRRGVASSLRDRALRRGFRATRVAVQPARLGSVPTFACKRCRRGRRLPGDVHRAGRGRSTNCRLALRWVRGCTARLIVFA